MENARSSAASTVTLLMFVLASATGCEPISLTALAIGGATGVQHTLNGMTYRTFTAPAPRVKSATLAALGRMGIKVDTTERTEGGEVIKASTPDRQIEVEVEKISANTTRLRAVARKGNLLYDSATSTEIILQTEKILGTG